MNGRGAAGPDQAKGGRVRRNEIVPGFRFPDLELPDHVGNLRRLADLAAGDPVLLQFYRGWWCPKEQASLRNLVLLQDEAEVAYTSFVSISVDPPPVTAAFRAGLGARWTFLSDEDRRWVDRLGLVEVADPGNAPYLPTVLTLLPDLTVHSVYNGYWYWGRPTNEELRLDFRQISRQVRAEWEPPVAAR